MSANIKPLLLLRRGEKLSHGGGTLLLGWEDTKVGKLASPLLLGDPEIGLLVSLGGEVLVTPLPGRIQAHESSGGRIAGDIRGHATISTRRSVITMAADGLGLKRLLRAVLVRDGDSANRTLVRCRCWGGGTKLRGAGTRSGKGLGGWKAATAVVALVGGGDGVEVERLGGA